jgi:hypothetical protein
MRGVTEDRLHSNIAPFCFLVMDRAFSTVTALNKPGYPSLTSAASAPRHGLVAGP